MAHIRKVLAKVNVAAHLCELALGPHHPAKYKALAGLAIMATGVGISKIPHFVGVHAMPFEFCTDCFGFLVHGIGCVPFLDMLIKASESGAAVAEGAAAVAEEVA